MKRRNIILAVDDTPERYIELERLLRPDGYVLVCLQHPDAFDMVMRSDAVAWILLDHDMPSYEWDDQTNAVHLTEKFNGQYFARWLTENLYGEDRVPVIVSSANPAGAQRIFEILSAVEYPVQIISVTESMPEERWLRVISNSRLQQEIEETRQHLSEILDNAEKQHANDQKD